MDQLIGTTLGGYTLKRLIGSGGMGAVYLAEDTSIGQQVAIKVIRADADSFLDTSGSQGSTSIAERFRQEARAVAALDHLHILPLYRYGEEETITGRRAYMVMQYRPEGSLWDWIRKRAGLMSHASLLSAPKYPEGLPFTWPMSVDEAGEYLHQAASALQYAHDHGIVHRDIKPANFLMRFDLYQAGNGNKKVFLLLSDFGLAKLYASTTNTSSIFGTPIYMAPEQFTGAARPESDQYALATMIYYFLTGHTPFEGDPLQLMHHHITTEPPSLRTWIPTLPEGVDSVLRRALAKKPEERFPSTTAFADAFTQQAQTSAGSSLQATVAANTPILLRPTVPVERQSHIQAHTPLDEYSAATEYAPPAVPGLIRQPTGRSSFAPQSQTRIATPSPSLASPSSGQQNKHTISRRTALGCIIGGAAVLTISAGTGIALFEARHRQNSQEGTTPATTITLTGHTKKVNSLAWSPDGTLLLSGSADTTVRVWNPQSSQQPVRIFTKHMGPVLTVGWSPQQVIATGSADTIVQVWNVADTISQFFTLDAVVDSLSWAPQTGRSLFANTEGNGVFEIFPLQSRSLSFPVRFRIRSVAVSPREHFLAAGFDSGSIGIISLAAKQRRTLSSPRIHSGTVAALAWSPNGAQLASGGGNTVIIQDVSLTGTLSNSRILTYNTPIQGISWDPQGNRLAIVTGDNNFYVWTRSDNTSTIYKTTESSIISVAWGKGGLATGTANGAVLIWNI